MSDCQYLVSVHDSVTTISLCIQFQCRMENTLPASDDEEEEDWMAINWNGNLPSGTKLLHSKNSLDDTESLSKGL